MEKASINDKPIIASIQGAAPHFMRGAVPHFAKLYLLKSGGKIIFSLVSSEEMFLFSDEPLEPELLYSGGENALFRRRPDQFILIEKVPEEFFSEEEVRSAIFNKKEVFFSEKKTSASPARDFTVNIRLIFEKLETSESFTEGGYPLYTSLRALVCANEDKPIADVIGKEDYFNLAAVLAREENYTLLQKYIDEKLPINGRVSSLFKKWQPTALHYITTDKVFGFLKDPLKMIRFLAANGANPNMPCEEGDTPLANQCLDNGLLIIIKALLDIGADPNCSTKIRSGYIKPLHLMLLPANYNKRTHEFTLINSSDLERIKLLVNSGADVNYKGDSGLTALSLAINNSEGKLRSELIKFLLEKGADLQSAIEALTKDVEQGHSKSAFSLYEIYSSRIEGLNIKPDSSLARKYLCASADLINKLYENDAKIIIEENKATEKEKRKI